LCQRYFQELCSGASGNAIVNVSYYTATAAYGHVKLSTEMRATPTLAVADVTHFILYSNGTGLATTGLIASALAKKSIELQPTTSAKTAGHSGFMRTTNTASSIQLIAEL
jgi:hypothetical protein